jgi:hypothetical protein
VVSLGLFVACSGNGEKTPTKIADGTYTRDAEITKTNFGGYTSSTFPSYGLTIVIEGNVLKLSKVIGNDYTQYTYTLAGTEIKRSLNGVLVETTTTNQVVNGGKATIVQKLFYREGRIEVEYRMTYTETSNPTTFPVDGGYSCLIVYTK